MDNITSYKQFILLKEDKEFTNNTKWKDSLVGKGIAGLFRGASFIIDALLQRTTSGIAKKIDREMLKGVILWCAKNNINPSTGKSYTSSSDDSNTTTDNTDTPDEINQNVEFGVEYDFNSKLNQFKTNKYKTAISNLEKLYKSIKTKEDLEKLENTNDEYTKSIFYVEDDSGYDKISQNIKKDINDISAMLNNIDNKLKSYTDAGKKQKKQELNDDIKYQEFLKDEKQLEIDKSDFNRQLLESNDELLYVSVLKDVVNLIKKNLNTSVNEAITINRLLNKSEYSRNEIKSLKNEIPNDVLSLDIKNINLVLISRAMTEIDKKKFGSDTDSTEDDSLYGDKKPKTTSKDEATYLVDVNAIYKHQLEAEMIYTDEDGRTEKKEELKWKKKIATIRSKYKDVLNVDKLDPLSNSFILSDDKRKSLINNSMDEINSKRSNVENSITVSKYVETFGLEQNPWKSSDLFKTNEKNTFIVTLNWDAKNKKNPINTATMAVKFYKISDELLSMVILEIYDKNFIKNFNITSNPDIKNLKNEDFKKYINGSKFIPQPSGGLKPNFPCIIFKNPKFPVEESDYILNDGYTFTMVGSNFELYVSELSTILKKLGNSVSIDSQLNKDEKNDLLSNRLILNIYRIYKIKDDNKKLLPIVETGSENIKKHSSKIVELFKKLKTVK